MGQRRAHGDHLGIAFGMHQARKAVAGLAVMAGALGDR
jgi:hypothetical protein